MKFYWFCFWLSCSLFYTFTGKQTPKLDVVCLQEASVLNDSVQFYKVRDAFTKVLLSRTALSLRTEMSISRAKHMRPLFLQWLLYQIKFAAPTSMYQRQNVTKFFTPVICRKIFISCSFTWCLPLVFSA